MPDDVASQRDVVELPGAVGIVALDDRGRVALVRQYRHPVRRRLWEIPAGLLDSTLEPAVEAGQRELAEEANVLAAEWHTLLDILTSPGMSDETVRVLLARSLTAIPEAERHAGAHEESDMEVEFVPLEEALRRIYRGEIENAITVTGLLAAERALLKRMPLRPANAPWPARKQSVPSP